MDTIHLQPSIASVMLLEVADTSRALPAEPPPTNEEELQLLYSNLADALVLHQLSSSYSYNKVLALRHLQEHGPRTWKHCFNVVVTSLLSISHQSRNGGLR